MPVSASRSYLRGLASLASLPYLHPIFNLQFPRPTLPSRTKPLPRQSSPTLFSGTSGVSLAYHVLRYTQLPSFHRRLRSRWTITGPSRKSLRLQQIFDRIPNRPGLILPLASVVSRRPLPNILILHSLHHWLLHPVVLLPDPTAFAARTAASTSSLLVGSCNTTAPQRSIDALLAAPRNLSSWATLGVLAVAPPGLSTQDEETTNILGVCCVTASRSTSATKRARSTSSLDRLVWPWRPPPPR